MKLVDMKNTKAEAKAEISPTYTAPEYPWGLQVNLNTQSLDKLGLEKLPAVGKTFVLTALVTVTSVSERENKKEANRSMELQITDLSLDAPSSKGDAAKALYSGSE
jgi:hypothetical protein